MVVCVERFVGVYAPQKRRNDGQSRGNQLLQCRRGKEIVRFDDEAEIEAAFGGSFELQLPSVAWNSRCIAIYLILLVQGSSINARISISNEAQPRGQMLADRVLVRPSDIYRNAGFRVVQSLNALQAQIESCFFSLVVNRDQHGWNPVG